MSVKASSVRSMFVFGPVSNGSISRFGLLEVSQCPMLEPGSYGFGAYIFTSTLLLAASTVLPFQYSWPLVHAEKRWASVIEETSTRPGSDGLVDGQRASCFV